MSTFFTINHFNMELIAMALHKPTMVYAEHSGYVAPSMVVLTATEIDDLLDNHVPEHKQQQAIEHKGYASQYVGECAMCGEPLPKRIYSDNAEICNTCLSSLIGE